MNSRSGVCFRRCLKLSLKSPGIQASIRRFQCPNARVRGSPVPGGRTLRRLNSEVKTRAEYEGKIVNNSEESVPFAIVVAKFNSLVTKELLNGARKALEDFNTTNVDVYWVPGSFELPSVAKSLAESNNYAAVICLGAVIRGGTSHYDAVVSATTSGILQASLSASNNPFQVEEAIVMCVETPVIFGVLTCDTMEQALDRAGGKMGNKGYEAASSAMEMANLYKQIKHAN